MTLLAVSLAVCAVQHLVNEMSKFEGTYIINSEICISYGTISGTSPVNALVAVA